MNDKSLANLKLGSQIKKKCKWCNIDRTVANLLRHETACYLNPVNTKLCPVCQKPIKNFRTSSTCGYKCANTLYRSGVNNPNWKNDRYQTTCFVHHKKECVVCKEHKIVEVHHYDENHKNNNSENLVPLCSTHHKYWHSRYRKEIIDVVDKYVKDYINNMN